MTATPPRPGRLLTGGNATELWWATATLTIAICLATVWLIAWVALATEAALAGHPHNTIGPNDVPGLLARIVAGEKPPTVEQPWRPASLAAALTATLGAAAVVGLRRWWAWRDGWRHRRRTRERVTSHAWASRRDLADLRTRPPRGRQPEPAAAGRLYVGSLGGDDLTMPPRTSVMVVAPTRTGKSTRLVVPNLLRWDGPAVVTSVKRDVYDLTVHRRADIGPTVLFDPTGSCGLDSVRWSPLLSSTTFPDATRTAVWLADAAAVQERQDNAKFWETLATKLLAPMLYAAANTRRTITDVSHWVDRSAFDEVELLLLQLGDDDAHAAWQAIRDLPHETRGSVLGTAMAIFRAFGSPRVRAATCCTPADIGADDVLDIGGLLAANGTVYLVSPEYEQTELRPVFVALVQAIYRAAVEISANLLKGAPLNPPLLLMLDEAGNIAPLQSLPKIASTGAGQGITLMTIWQDRAQIRAIYGDHDRTVIANHTTTLWLPGSQDLDTLKLLTDLVGDQWVAATNISTGPDGGLSVSEGSERIDVAPPAFLRTLEADKAVMLTGNRLPALIDTHAYYHHRRWRRHIHHDVLEQYSAAHGADGPTTADRWADGDHAERSTHDAGTERAVRERPALGEALGADYPLIPCNRLARAEWGLDDQLIPNGLSSAPGQWQSIALPPAVIAELGGMDSADLSRAPLRRRVLEIWLETGPARQLAAAFTLPQLQADWPSLRISAELRAAWQDCYPALVDDSDAEDPHPSCATAHER